MRMGAYACAYNDLFICEKLALMRFGACFLAKHWPPWAFWLVKLGSCLESYHNDFCT